MAHMIGEHDRGLVGFEERFGGTWHELPQFKVQPGELAAQDVRGLFDYDVVKSPVLRQLQDGTFAEVQDAYCLVRTDLDVQVWPNVGNLWTPIKGTDIVDMLMQHVVGNIEGAQLESAGTLDNGRLQFVNILLDQFRIPGDESEQVYRLMVSNAFGGRCNSACFHGVRIVCNNTLRAAEMQGLANKTLQYFRHTSGAAEKAARYLEQLAQVKQGLNAQKEALTAMVDVPMNRNMVSQFLDRLFPPTKAVEDQSARSATMRENKMVGVLKLWDNRDDLQGGVRHTAYSMLQAVTDWSDHVFIGNNDTGYLFDDGLFGMRDGIKQTAYKELLALAS
jgi:phage/plasmid-like protein (TIGR03299 family)